jgi:hypothetical protein
MSSMTTIDRAGVVDKRMLNAQSSILESVESCSAAVSSPLCVQIDDVHIQLEFGSNGGDCLQLFVVRTVTVVRSLVVDFPLPGHPCNRYPRRNGKPLPA